MNKIDKLRESIYTSEQGTVDLLKKIEVQKFNPKDYDLINKVLQTINNCFQDRIQKYISEYELYLQELEKQEDRKRHNLTFDRPFDDEKIKEPKIPKMGDCIQSVKSNFPKEAPINFFPSSKPGNCQPQCIVLSSGDWDFNDTELRRDITNYWFRCFYKNRFTLVFTQSWQHTSWGKWETIIKGFVAPQEYEIAGRTEKVNHSVAIIEYSEDAVNLRFARKSI